MASYKAVLHALGNPRTELGDQVCCKLPIVYKLEAVL